MSGLVYVIDAVLLFALEVVEVSSELGILLLILPFLLMSAGMILFVLDGRAQSRRTRELIRRIV